VCVVCSASSGLYHGMMSRPEEFRWVCDLETLTMRRAMPELGFAPQKNKIIPN